MTKLQVKKFFRAENAVLMWQMHIKFQNIGVWVVRRYKPKKYSKKVLTNGWT